MLTLTPAVKLEKRVLTECLTLYKEFPCLWDNRQVIYGNKEAREHAYEILLEKYRQWRSKAKINDVKKKIENMRASYRREHKKVLLAQKKGDEHVPQLWYYDLMEFLDEVMDYSLPEDSTEEMEYVNSPSQIKRTTSPALSNAYLDDDGSNETQLIPELDNVPKPALTSKYQPNSESEAFGTTLGLQLKELDNMQKIIAEKLISDVIYYARLKKLTFDSYLVL